MVLNRFVVEYFSGMKKCLSIFLVLLGENEFLIFDELFLGFDVSGIFEVVRIIK